MRRLLLTVLVVLGTLTVWATAGSADTGISTDHVPTATCGPGSHPETAEQGRIPGADYASGRYLQGYTCNTEAISHEGSSGGFKALRYTDAAGNTCAYYDSTSLVPPTSTISNLLGQKGIGVVVLDMNDPAHPKRTATLTSVAMLSPHESLLVNQPRGLLIGVLGTFLTAPGALDVYDVRTDCRHPKLLSTSLAGILGHESGFAPDGRTLYVSSTIFTLVAVNLDDPRHPRTTTIQTNVQYHGLRVSDDGNTLYAAHIGQPGPDLISGGGLRILDVSQVQARAANPKISILSTMTWAGSSIPQVAEPFTRDGHEYVFEVDEFTDLFSLSGLTDLRHAPVGAARIIDVDDPRHPFLVSNVRLQVHEPANHSGEQWNDPGGNNSLGGYAAHYCSVPTRDDPNLAGCSMILSGLRIFDIRDVAHPKEVAYFNMPTNKGGDAFSQPAWDAANDSVWYTDTSTGFWNVRLTNGVQDLLD
ncbi:MAG: LVIVD repeat-containing protein [Marmoricola sp.]